MSTAALIHPLIASLGNPVNPDGIFGYGMLDGTIPGFATNFGFTVVPEPATVWLLGSSLVGQVVGVVRRRKVTA